MKKWGWGVVVFVLLILMLIVGFWEVSNLPSLANQPWSIAVRRFFTQDVAPKVGITKANLLGDITPVLKAQDEDSYVYSLIGELITLDTERGMLTLQSKRGGMYSVRYSHYPGMSLMYRVKREGKFVEIDSREEPLDVGSQLHVQWSDARELPEITSSAAGDGERHLVNQRWNEQDYLRVIKQE